MKKYTTNVICSCISSDKWCGGLTCWSTNNPHRLDIDVIARLDTGWNCCVCNEVGRVMGNGFTWCKKHWEEFDLGYSRDDKGYPITVASMRSKFKEK